MHRTQSCCLGLDCISPQVSATRHLRDDLAVQLERVQEERARAKAQRESLAAALEAKRGPLAQVCEGGAAPAAAWH